MTSTPQPQLIPVASPNTCLRCGHDVAAWHRPCSHPSGSHMATMPPRANLRPVAFLPDDVTETTPDDADAWAVYRYLTWADVAEHDEGDGSPAPDVMVRDHVADFPDAAAALAFLATRPDLWPFDLTIPTEPPPGCHWPARACTCTEHATEHATEGPAEG